MRFDTEIRGYPLDASGVTLPCARIAGAHTLLFERGPLAVSVHGNLHSLSFQAEAGLTIHEPYADGDAAPNRSVTVGQDHVALAVDSHLNDFVVASEGYEGDACWFVVPNDATRSDTQYCDPYVSAVHALTTDRADELIVIGTDLQTRGTRIDVFAGAAAPAPRLVRTIGGPQTGLPALGPDQGYFDVSFALAADPQSGALYVYSHLYDILDSRQIAGAAPPSIAEFAPAASGNVAPLRVLTGSNVALPQAAFSVNPLGSDDTGNLYVLGGGTSAAVSVYGPTARGNAVAERSFTDPTAALPLFGASLALRTMQAP